MTWIWEDQPQMAHAMLPENPDYARNLLRRALPAIDREALIRKGNRWLLQAMHDRASGKPDAPTVSEMVEGVLVATGIISPKGGPHAE